MTFRPGTEAWANRDFVRFWRRFYNTEKYPDEIYESNLAIGRLLAESNILELLAWKFGIRNQRPDRRMQSVAEWVKVVHDNIVWLSDLRSFDQLDHGKLDYYIEQSRRSVRSINRDLTMGVFLLHVSRPQDFPMLDQHVLRAWHFICTCKVSEPPASAENYGAYRTFFFDFCDRSESSFRDADKALMSFGQFLQRFCTVQRQK